jgi:membrane-anchored protein YejM (alkaline phosphatase superfamily)
MNLLLISIDSLRLDFVSRTGLRVSTPRFDASTRDFGFYDRLFSVSSATRPVHSTLFTGLYPFEHGVLGQRSPLMRPQIPHLFDLFQRQGARVGGFSEARDIFSGLTFAEGFEPLDPTSATGLRQLYPFLQRAIRQQTFLFLHYWSVHTPYGAADGQAFGEIGQLLATGQISQVQNYYTRAVETLFEEKIAPLLALLPLDQWAIFIFSDHGESWTNEEPYHGQTLRNSVLRIPLFYHIPFTGNPPLSPPLLSLIDLFPTLVSLFDLPLDYNGFGWDIRSKERPERYLAQIHPTVGPDDLGEASPSVPIIGESAPGHQWALFDSLRKFTFDEGRQRGKLERTMSEEPLVEEGAQEHYLQLFREMESRSSSSKMPHAKASRSQEDLLDSRLRDLGYLD